MFAAGPIFNICKRNPLYHPTIPSLRQTCINKLSVVSFGFRLDCKRVRAKNNGYTTKFPMHDEKLPIINFSITFGSDLFLYLLYECLSVS